MIKISVVIITLNEEKNIERCLLSVSDIADEVIVLDSFSSDKTEAICQKHNVKFYQHIFDGHIQQKNRAITYASNPIILSLDADEELSEELKKSIREVKGNWSADGYYFNRLNNYCGKWIRHTVWYPDKKLRLWDSRKGKWEGENPHDRFVLENGATEKFLKGDLLHYSFFSIHEHVLQINKFTTIAANEKFKKGVSVNFFNYTFRPCWEFFRSYLLKLGFLDGYYGFIVSLLSSWTVFLKYIKLKELWNNARK